MRRQRQQLAMIWLRVPLMLAAIVIMVASLLPFGARAWWILEQFAHFRVQYLACALALFVLLALVRRPRWCAALALCIAINFVAVIDYLPTLGRGPTRDVAAAERAIRVLSVNLSQRDFSAEELLKIIRAEAPDLLLLVELTPRSVQELEALDALYPYRIKAPSPDAFGLGLLSRYDLNDAQIFQLGAAPAIRARLLTQEGPLVFFGVHLLSPIQRSHALERNAQLLTLAALRADISEPVVIAGDFNISPYSPFLADWLDATQLRDPGATRGPRFSWPAFLPILGIPIDHCVVSAHIRVNDFRRLPPFGSDHYPILAELVLP